MSELRVDVSDVGGDVNELGVADDHDQEPVVEAEHVAQPEGPAAVAQDREPAEASEAPVRSGGGPDDAPRVVLVSQLREYSHEDLHRDLDRSLLRVSGLPGFGSGEGGYGWGDEVERWLGGGLGWEEVIAVVARNAGAGKTIFVDQLKIGLAMKSRLIARGSLGGNVLTPVITLSEMSPRAQHIRAACQYMGVDIRVVRAGKTALDGATSDEEREAIRAQQRRAVEALDPSKCVLAQALKGWCVFVRQLPGVSGEPGPRIRTPWELREAVLEVRRRVESRNPGKEVVPVVVVDPSSRELENENNYVRAVEEEEWVAERLRELAIEAGCVVICVVDTNKASAGGQNKTQNALEEGVMAAKGAYALIHEASTVLYLRRPMAVEGAVEQVEVVFVKNRWGPTSKPEPKAMNPRFEFVGKWGRLIPMPVEEVERRVKSEAAEYMRQKEARKSKRNGLVGERKEPDISDA